MCIHSVYTNLKETILWRNQIVSRNLGVGGKMAFLAKMMLLYIRWWNNMDVWSFLTWCQITDASNSTCIGISPGNPYAYEKGGIWNITSPPYNCPSVVCSGRHGSFWLKSCLKWKCWSYEMSKILSVTLGTRNVTILPPHLSRCKRKHCSCFKEDSTKCYCELYIFPFATGFIGIIQPRRCFLWSKNSTSEISKWNSKVFPGSSLEALFHTRCISIFERSLCW